VNKPTIAITSLTCCEGCQVAVLDLGERFLELTENVKIGDFAFLEEEPGAQEFDIVFVEGAPLTEANKQRLFDLRKRSKILVALGACAALGGIAEIKDYQDKEERVRYVYKNFESIQNPDVKSLKELVKVDLEIPGCPINKEEFWEIVKKLISFYEAGILGEQMPKIPQRPVCYECQLKQNRCLLQKGLFSDLSAEVLTKEEASAKGGLPCLGPIMLAGCGAPCPSSSYPCDGCRGPIKNINPENLNKQLAKQGYNKKEIDMILQRFGVLEETYPTPPVA
jgi:coenzyme F420-reducing hydrogenase gamma subunit